MKFIRIRPYDKRRGQLVQRYVYRGFRFEVARGWYQVEDHIAEELAGVLTFPDNPDSKPVFDVATKEEAEALSMREYEAAHPERKISEAIAGAQTVTEEKLGEPAPDAAKGGKKKKAAKKKAAKGDEAKGDEAEGEKEKGGSKTPFGN
jgi:hypothetical protein